MTVLREPLDDATREEVAGFATDDDRVAFEGRQMYWRVADKLMDSGLSNRGVDRLLSDRWTLRTANTVRRVLAKLPD